VAEREGAGWAARDEAVARLEDHVLGLPYDVALPSLGDLLDDAGVHRELLRRDERARKVVLEAILARPLADTDEVASRTAEVELLTLEVSVLTEHLRAARGTDVDAAARERAAAAGTRLDAIRARLDELRSGL
jgi:hypothetical protein